VRDLKNEALLSSGVRGGRRSIKLHFAQAIAWGLLLFGLMAVGEYISVRNLPAGTQFVLSSHSYTALSHNIKPAIGISLVVGFLTLGALSIRPWLRWVLTGFIFYLLVIPLGTFGGTNAVAIVQRGDIFVVVKRFPLASKLVHAAQIDEMLVRNSESTRQLILFIHRNGEIPEPLNCEYVRRSDLQTSATLGRLVDALHSARVAAGRE